MKRLILFVAISLIYSCKAIHSENDVLKTINLNGAIIDLSGELLVPTGVEIFDSLLVITNKGYDNIFSLINLNDQSLCIIILHIYQYLLLKTKD
jgi:hypothetical protein